MTTTDPLERLGDRMSALGQDRLEAVVAVEQARAVAQVAAAVQVAQRFPRDLGRVRAELADACASYDLAAVAFYSLPNRGQGMTVHVLAELAVLWGNVDAGVHELRRDDERGMSEVQAFAWDVQRNSRHTRTFQVPHAIMARGKRQKIDDLLDVYRNNMSTGARAYRECVTRILPRWVTDEAERRLRETLNRGPGKPVEQRRVDAVAWGQRVGVTQAQLEQRVGKPLASWGPEDLATLEVVARSIGQGETTAAEQFDPAPERVTVAELAPREPAPSPPAPPRDVATAEPEPVGDQRPATQRMVGAVISRLRDLGVEDDDEQRAWLSRELQRPIESRRDLTRADASTCIEVLDVLIAEQGAMPGSDA